MIFFANTGAIMASHRMALRHRLGFAAKRSPDGKPATISAAIILAGFPRLPGLPRQSLGQTWPASLIQRSGHESSSSRSQ